MPKEYKIKRSKGGKRVYKARPHPLFIILMIFVVAGLIFLGTRIYPPIYEAIMNWSSREEQSEPPPTSLPEEPTDDDPEPTPAPEPVQTATGLKAVYLPRNLMADYAAMNAYLDTLAGTHINAVMVDIKDRNGNLFYLSGNQRAQDNGAITAGAFDLAEVNQNLKNRGLSLIVRMSAFRDMLAASDLDISVNYRTPGTNWLDNFPDAGGRPWLNPYSAGAKAYLTELALEAVDKGAVMVVLEDFQFPPNSLTGDAYFAESAGVSRTEALAAYAQELTEALAQKGARAAIYMPVSTLSAEPNLTLYGGPAQDILTADTSLLGLLPYQFQENYVTEGLSIPRPMADLAETTRLAAAFALSGLAQSQPMALIMGGNEVSMGTAYTQAQVKAQAETLASLGITEYVLYCTDTAGYLLW